MLWVTHLFLEVFLLLLGGLLVVALVQRRQPSAAKKPTRRTWRVVPYRLVVALVLMYGLWHLVGLTMGVQVMGSSPEAFRDQVFGEGFSFASHEEAQAVLGQGRYERLLEEGASLSEMAAVVKGAPSDPARIAAIEQTLRGEVRDLMGTPLIDYAVDAAAGTVTRRYDAHPGLRRLLGEFSPSPVWKSGLEWAYRDVLVPTSDDAYERFNRGQDLNLSLHAALQRICYEALQINGVQRKGSVVVMNPHTGDVYAMVSSPAGPPPTEADAVVDGLGQTLLFLQKRLLRLAEHVREDHAPALAMEALDGAEHDYDAFRNGLRALRYRFHPDTLTALDKRLATLTTVLNDTRDFLLTPPEERADAGLLPGALEAGLVALDWLRRATARIHRNALAQAFYAHEQMHFRQSPQSLGSAFKPFVAALAEEAGLAQSYRMTLREARVAGVPRKILKFEQDHLPREDRRRAIGVAEGMQRSLNLVFAPLSKAVQDELGTERMVQYFERFGFNQPLRWHTAHARLNRAFPIHSSQLYADRLTPHSPQYYRANIYSLGIGGENMMRVTPLHVAMMASYLANGETMPFPKIERDLAPAVFARPALKRETLAQVRAWMRGSVTARRGTSHSLYQGDLKPLYLAAKTGTSTRLLHPYEQDKYGLRGYTNPPTGYHAWHVTLAGLGDADLRAVVVVSLHDAIPAGYTEAVPQSEWASRAAAPVTRRVLEALLELGYFAPRPLAPEQADELLAVRE